MGRRVKQQQAVGRKEGVGNMKRTPSGGYINQYGVEFSAEDKKKLTYAVNSANRKRKRLLEEQAQLARIVGGKPTEDTVASLQLMGKESDFILSPKSKSMQRFRTREAFENYLENLHRVNQRGYIDQRTEQYRENYLKAVDHIFGDEAEDVKKALQNMSLAEYRKLVAQTDEDLEFGYIYLEEERGKKLNVIRRALGLETKDLPVGDTEVSLKQRASQLSGKSGTTKPKKKRKRKPKKK